MELYSKFIEDLLLSPISSGISKYMFSQYIPGPKGITLERENIRVSNLNELFSLNFKRHLKNSEIAFHNIVLKNRKRFYIPMIDLSISNLNQINDINNIKLIDAPMYIYKSGRSYHVYFLYLMTKSEWTKFLGSCLLLNDRNKPFEFVDSRWIGHSLEKNYSALRLTNNNSYYLQNPELIQIIY